MAGKKTFYKVDCFQAYHCIPIADEHSVIVIYLWFQN